MSTITTVEDVQRTNTNGIITTILPPDSPPSRHERTGVVVYWALVTPEQARELLKMNTHNRRLDKTDVIKLQGAIERGEHTVSTNGVDISSEGVLLDGQHRLWAIIESGKATSLLIAENVPPEAQKVKDIHKVRKFNQMLGLEGEQNHNQLGPAVRVLFNYITTGQADTQNIQVYPTPQQLFDLLEAHPGLRDSARLVGKNKAITRLMTPGIATALHYLFGQADQNASDEFFRAIATGGMSNIPQVNLLHDTLYRGSVAATRLPGKRRSAYAIKAWNAWRSGKEVKVLRWGGANKVGSPYSKEKFPVIHGCPVKAGKPKTR